MDDDDDDDDMRVCVCVRDLLFGGQFAIGRVDVFVGESGHLLLRYSLFFGYTVHRQMVFVDGIENVKYRFGVGA